MEKEKNQELIKAQETYLPSTPAKLLEIYNPNTLRRSLAKVKTVKQAIQTETPSIGVMVKKYGVEKVEPYIKVWLINLNEVLNLKRPLKEHQIDECAYLVVDKYKNITIADINIIFKKAKSGEYGELYESLSVDKVLRWFAEYQNVRCDIAGLISREQAWEYKRNEMGGERSCETRSIEYHKERVKDFQNQQDKMRNQNKEDE